MQIKGQVKPLMAYVNADLLCPVINEMECPLNTG